MTWTPSPSPRLAGATTLWLGAGLLLAACEPADLDVPEAVFDPGGPAAGAFFDVPFPADARTNDQGGLDWTLFPNPTQLSLLDDFLAQASARPGAGFNGPTWLRFDGPIDLDALPTPEGSLAPASNVQLIDLSPDSPTFLERVPVAFEWLEGEGAYLPGNLLGIAPVAGFPLRPRTTYALVVRDRLAAPSPAFVDAMETGSGAWGASLDTLVAALPDLGFDADDLGVATVFTTADPVGEMDRVVRTLRERVTLPPLRNAVELVEEEAGYRVFRSEYTTPLWMAGDKPWATEGGAFVFRDDGLAEVQAWEPMRASLVVPPASETPEPPPATGYPLLVYLHGTGGDWRTFCNTSTAYEVGFWGMEDGFLGLGIDLPLHGPRGTSDTQISLHSFNVLQPDSALHIHRQGALDLLALLEILRRDPPTFTSPEGETWPVDPDRIVVVGHSQGGLAGALAMPWMDGRAKAAVLSGAGGLLAITAVERDADYDFPTLIRTLLGFAEDEALTELHPVLGLVQHLVEPTDPINYAPYWFHEDAGFSDTPVPVLLTGGVRDDATPPRTAEALAAAARLPFVGERYTVSPGPVLRGFGNTTMPLQDNVTAWDGTPMTSGFAQFFSGDHFALFRLPETRDMVRTFLLSALDDAPILDDSPLPDPEVP